MEIFDPARIQTAAAAVLSLSLVPQRTNIDFAPNPAIPYACQMIWKELFTRFYSTSLYMDSRHGLHDMQFLFSLHAAEDFLSILRLAESISSTVEKQNAWYQAKEHFYFRYSIAADFQQTAYIADPAPCVPSESRIWTGNLWERGLKVVQNAPAGHASSLFLTHTFYEQLPEEARLSYDICYYIMHICCYGKTGS